jgi:microcystin degradation protein MlrC
MTSQSVPDVEGELLRRLRALPGYGSVPIGGVTDLHANFSARMAENSNGLVTYRENPHTDAKESAVRAAHLLDRVMSRGQLPVTLWQHPPVMWPPTGTATADEPMLSLEKLARSMEEENPELLAVNVHAGFSFADTPDTGVSFSIVTAGEPELARQKLAELSRLAVEHRAVGNVVDPPVEEVMPKVKKLLQERGSGPIILVEPSDNIGGGAPGDGTGILRALVEHEIENAAVVINDPLAVAAVSGLGAGGKMTVSIGGRGSHLSGGPATLEVVLISTSDGKFVLEDLHSHMASMNGAHIDMGPCAVVRHKSIQILLTTRKTAPMDLGQLRSQGIVPESLAVIGVKAAVAHRRAYDPIARASFNVATPGPCASDLRTLPFKLVDRSVYPLAE